MEAVTCWRHRREAQCRGRQLVIEACFSVPLVLTAKAGPYVNHRLHEPAQISISTPHVGIGRLTAVTAQVGGVQEVKSTSPGFSNLVAVDLQILRQALYCRTVRQQLLAQQQICDEPAKTGSVISQVSLLNKRQAGLWSADCPSCHAGSALQPALRHGHGPHLQGCTPRCHPRQAGQQSRQAGPHGRWAVLAYDSRLRRVPRHMQPRIAR